MTLDLTDPTTLSALDAAAERDLARTGLLDFIEYVRENYQANWHHEFICQIVQDWIEGKGPPRIMLEMPPAHGKSEIVSRCTPAYILGTHKAAKIIACSHTQSLANEMSIDVREIMRGEPFETLFGRKLGNGGAMEAWRTLDGSRYTCAGIGGPVTGKHFDFGIIDDPVKNAEEAFSPTMREKAWQWYTRVFRQRRIGGNARMLLTTTRWHEDDLAGRILKREKGKWTRIRLPAIAEAGSDHRGTGDALWPDRYNLEFLNEEKELNPHAFSALYQQRPVAEGGGMLKREWLKRYEKNGSPDLVKVNGTWRNVKAAMRYLTVDLAASTKDTGDYTVIGVWASFKDGHLALLDVIRKRMEGPDIVPEIALVLNRHHCGAAHIEKIGFQTALIQTAQRQGLPVRELRPDKDKVTRAAPLAALMANGKFWLPESAPWLPDFEDELATFPAGMHDDQVDVAAYGVRVHNDRIGWGAKRTALY